MHVKQVALCTVVFIFGMQIQDKCNWGEGSMYNNTGWIEKYCHAHTVSDDFLNTSEYKHKYKNMHGGGYGESTADLLQLRINTW